jgi:hypothetical protein
MPVLFKPGLLEKHPDREREIFPANYKIYYKPQFKQASNHV